MRDWEQPKEEEMEKKIVPVLRKMKVGAKEVYPIERISSIKRTVYGDNMVKERRIGMKWSVNISEDGQHTIVTRQQ